MSQGGAGQLTEEQSTRAAALVADRHGISGRLVPVRAGVTHVFRVDDVVVRVSQESVDAARELRLVQWLATHDIPVARPLSDVEMVEGRTGDPVALRSDRDGSRG